MVAATTSQTTLSTQQKPNTDGAPQRCEMKPPAAPPTNAPRN